MLKTEKVFSMKCFFNWFVEISCGDPGAISNGTRTGEDFSFGRTVNYECDSGFKLIGSRNRTCQDSGQWSGEPPTCNGRHKYYRLRYKT